MLWCIQKGTQNLLYNFRLIFVKSLIHFIRQNLDPVNLRAFTLFITSSNLYNSWENYIARRIEFHFC